MAKVAIRSSVAWSPTDESGLTVWIDGADETTLYVDAGSTLVSSDGNAVYQANDKSGNGNNVVQTGAANRPLYKVNIQNGLSCLFFDGSNDSMVSAAYSSELSQPNTIFAVAKSLEAATQSHVVQDGIASTKRQQTYYRYNEGKYMSMYGGGFVENSQSWPSVFIVLASLFNTTSSALYINGASIASGNAGTHGMTGVTLGADYSPNAFFDGYIGELLIYDGDKSGVLSTVLSYLNNKWAVY